MGNFQDAARYERYMGGWSRAAGAAFLDWLALPAGQSWLDVGCGGGAFGVQILQHAAPATLHGIDISAAQLAYARAQLPAHVVLQQGDAAALSFDADTFDAVVMPLVIVFVPDPARAVAEMARVCKPGGTVATYIWDLPQGFPYAPAFALLHEHGVLPQRDASDDITQLPRLHALWEQAGLTDIATRAFHVAYRFPDFAAYWQALADSASIGEAFAALPPETRQSVQQALRRSLPIAADGCITCHARAHAVKGRRV
ncbi:class I SAM-dependent methyltransferase [Dentiradicibacter hellwigii]|uniref:Methyltransferase domain-containing protein n=1 Tax=Dentiradicibacter hellwigii TaxID=3149053 RepID=A0ABV4UGS0_9RHOO